MTDWTHYNNSKYAAKCCYCNRDVHTSEGRWTAPKMDGTKGRFVACHNCIPSPQTGQDASPPSKPSNPDVPVKPSSVVPPSSDSTAKPSYTPDNRIAKAHDENMLSAELTRACMTKLTSSIDMLCNAMNERTRILNDQIKKEG